MEVVGEIPQVQQGSQMPVQEGGGFTSCQVYATQDPNKGIIQALVGT